LVHLPQPLQADATDQGIIAYVQLSTHDIHLVSPDGTGDRVLWTAPRAFFVDPPYELAWRPDGRELAFTSDHEAWASWYESDVYAVGSDGTGYRRITNAPAAAELAKLPKGSVTVSVSNWTADRVQVYVAGAPELRSVAGDGEMTFDDVADLGPEVPQPAIGIFGMYRIMSSPPLADVQPNGTVSGGNLIIAQYSGIRFFGAGKVSWKADGSALAYAMRTCSGISQIPALPKYGSIGRDLPVVANTSPGLVAWGPTPDTNDRYLYRSGYDILDEERGGIYLNTVGDASGGTKLVPTYRAELVRDIEWLPDASGFLFTQMYVPLDIVTDVFEYSFATEQVKQLTDLKDDSARGLSISPDGRQVAFEREGADATSSLWIMNRDGSGLRKLADDAGRPAWGRVPAARTPGG
jgi:TolB protein